MNKYSIIVPLYNEELVIDECYRRLTEVMSCADGNYELVFVNDGSRDKTEELANKICDADKRVRLINFSRNFGHQIAISAGMDNATGQAIVIIDADLQDPPEVILEMIKKWQEGFEVVYGKRKSRKGETAFKKWTAALYYRMLNSMTNIDIPVDTGDFRLIDRKVCDAMKSLNEKNRYVRGLISWVGFRQTAVEYSRDERFAGETKYPLKKMIKFAADGMTSFSYKPLKLASYVGYTLSAASFLYLVYIVLSKLFGASFGVGWPSIVALSLFFNGIVLIMLGIMGEYIGRIYDECKGRPLYIISEKVGFGVEADQKFSDEA